MSSPHPLTIEECEQLFWLAARDFVFFSSAPPKSQEETGQWYAYVNIGDTFGYACADCEFFYPHQAQEIRAMYEKYGWAGVVAWVAYQRKEEPLVELQDEQYKVAMKEMQGRK